MQAQHPVTFFTKTEAASVKASLLKYPLLKSSYTDLKKDVDQWIGKDVDEICSIESYAKKSS